jgi:hypothetical protein
MPRVAIGDFLLQSILASLSAPMLVLTGSRTVICGWWNLQAR